MMPEFMHFILPNRRTIWLLGAASLFSVSVYLILSALMFQVGYPLDDSWIHLTYARNLALYGEWAFIPGKPSAGSTSPLWTALLSIGFLLRLGPYIWTYFMGVVILWGLGLLGEMSVRKYSSAYQASIPWVGLFFILEWHLVWLAASGMETLLFALLVTLVLSMVMNGSRQFLTLGLLAGLSVWVRPDGLTLLGPIFVHLIITKGSGKKRWKDFNLILLGFTALFIPYILFNLILAGSPFPNTFYAKQAEYVAWQARPFINRFGELSLQYLAGPSLALLPGVVGWFVISYRKHDWSTIAGMVWLTGYLLMYVNRLPVYQHGRYLMPTMPIFFVWGLVALFEFLNIKKGGRYHRLASTGWSYLTGVLCLVFWIVGASVYSKDVGLIETEMVVTAKWAANNIPADGVIAAHDIGALGYFDTHELIDLAGLITPEVIPIIRNEEKLAEYLDDKNTDYLIAFPDFYPVLSAQLQPAFVTDGIGRELGGENMTIFHWR
ncbi:MAG: hypothetical protein QGD88_02205 [Anaerolineae bacterium]|nr:hypothetical protein [Anaerolineae bacterium]